MVEPLQELAAVSRRLAQGYYRERTRIRSDDELAELSQSINQLAEALDRTEQRRLALIADVAHELRTPLTTIEGYMEGLLDGAVAADEPPERCAAYTLVMTRRDRRHGGREGPRHALAALLLAAWRSPRASWCSRPPACRCRSSCTARRPGSSACR
ncbi:MAG TPA: histidine kinase dimerization/phospho-acceptor domain-containing protein [Roseiflexaceae bacterium]|nr:histidine kinase dimerization/phospho-acceptor domain-containing protein [Roseiflexaceae bacterium]